MSPRNMGLTMKRSCELNREIETLLRNSSSDENTKKLLSLEIAKEIRALSLKKLFKILVVLTFVLLQIYMIPFLNWNASAIGRIVMIKMLKIWDWKYVYTMDCLIERNAASTFDYNQQATDDLYDECIFCESIEEIHHVWDISYSVLKLNYLNRGHPVIVVANQPLSQPTNLLDYVTKLQNLNNVINSNPCNLQTNLITGQSKSLKALLELTKKSSDGWFLHFRNCDFASVKASRALETQPYFFASHVKPFSSSWIVISNSYKAIKPKKLMLKHSVVVKQIIGSIDVLLEPKADCKGVCRNYLLQLEIGHTLVLQAELWNFYYIPTAGVSVTYLREYEIDV